LLVTSTILSAVERLKNDEDRAAYKLQCTREFKWELWSNCYAHVQRDLSMRTTAVAVQRDQGMGTRFLVDSVCCSTSVCLSVLGIILSGICSNLRTYSLQLCSCTYPLPPVLHIHLMYNASVPQPATNAVLATDAVWPLILTVTPSQFYREEGEDVLVTSCQ